MQERALYVITKDLSKLLHSWYKKYHRDLPWRSSKNAYHIWVSEIMLQQTQVTTVIPYYERWISTFPSIEDLANASREDILKLWEGLGYYSRAANLHIGAALVVENFKGILPQSFKDLLTIPGIGPYTAAAISSIAYDKAEGVVDGNVKRVLSRLFELYDAPNTKKFHTLCKELIEESFFSYSPSDMNQAWMELGALVCSPSSHCHSCPIKSFCQAYQHNSMSDFPIKTRKSAIPLRKGAIFIIKQNKHYLMVKRHDKSKKGKGYAGEGLLKMTNFKKLCNEIYCLANLISGL